jgi:uncharacterized protein (TIGR00266 family)
MQYDIRYGPSYALGIIYLEAGEQLQAETGAMVSMADTIKMQTAMRGGIMAGLRRSVLGGESFFINTFTAEAPGEVTIAPALPGDIIAVELSGQALLVQSGSFLAASPGINVDTKWGGGRSFFSSEGFFLLRCTGTGTIFLSSYGAIHQVDLAHGQRFVVDTGHMVAFDESVGYEVGRAGGWKTTLAGGEGLVVRVQGPGRFFLQTRNPQSFIDWIAPKLPSRRE